MSAAYASRFEAVFLCKHPKGPKMSYAAVGKYMGKSKTFVRKWVVWYESTKTVDDLPNRGVKRKFSEKDDKRILTVFLKNPGLSLCMSYAAIGKYMGKSKTFVRKWVVRYESTKTVDDLPDRGVKRKFSGKDDKRILTVFLKNPGLSLCQGQMKMEENGLNISLDTIQRHLKAHDVKWRSTIKKPLLTEKHAKARLAWAKENINRDWSKVIFSDEAFSDDFVEDK
ncbi:hypothetical protein ANTQUA_LOCUS4341, partial [Anthophora quadrimaculata]